MTWGAPLLALLRNMSALVSSFCSSVVASIGRSFGALKADETGRLPSSASPKLPHQRPSIWATHGGERDQTPWAVPTPRSPPGAFPGDDGNADVEMRDVGPVRPLKWDPQPDGRPLTPPDSDTEIRTPRSAREKPTWADSPSAALPVGTERLTASVLKEVRLSKFRSKRLQSAYAPRSVRYSEPARTAPSILRSRTETGWATAKKLRRAEARQQRTPPPEGTIAKDKDAATTSADRRSAGLLLGHGGLDGSPTSSRDLLSKHFAEPDVWPSKPLALSKNMRSQYDEEIARILKEVKLREEAERAAKEAKEREERELRLAKSGGLRMPNKPFITPVSTDWEKRAMETLQAAPGLALAQTAEGTDLRRHDFLKVVIKNEWLNDEIVNGALTWLDRAINSAAGIKDPKKQTRKCLAMSSFFWKRLVETGGKTTQRTLRRFGVEKKNFLDIDTILLPICDRAHWTLVVVRPTKRTIAYMDSMQPDAPVRKFKKHTDLVTAWLKDVLGDAYVQGKSVDDDDDDNNSDNSADDADWEHGDQEDGEKEQGWRVIRHEAPVQRNGWDCGVFTVTNAMCVSLGLNPVDAYVEEDMPVQRIRIASMLLNGGFNGEFDLRVY